MANRSRWIEKFGGFRQLGRKFATRCLRLFKWDPHLQPKTKGRQLLCEPSWIPEHQSSSHMRSSKKIHYTFAGWPGSAHDSRVWMNSPKFSELEINRDEIFPVGSFTISDSAYELRTFNITPYKNYRRISRSDRRFNKQHWKRRILIEQALGCRSLEGNFQGL